MPIPPTLDGRLRKFLKLRLQYGKIEEQLEELKPAVREDLEKLKNRSREFGGRVIRLLERTNRRLNKGRAEEVLGLGVLEQFYEESVSVYIDVK